MKTKRRIWPGVSFLVKQFTSVSSSDCESKATSKQFLLLGLGSISCPVSRLVGSFSYKIMPLDGYFFFFFNPGEPIATLLRLQSSGITATCHLLAGDRPPLAPRRLKGDKVTFGSPHFPYGKAQGEVIHQGKTSQKRGKRKAEKEGGESRKKERNGEEHIRE